MRPFFQSSPYSPRFQLSWFGIACVALACATLSSCSNSNKLPALNDAESALLDSISLFAGTLPSEALLGTFPQHRCTVESDSLYGADVMHLNWWKGPGLSERISLPWPDENPRNLTSVEDLGGLSIWVRKEGASRSVPVLVFELEDTRGMRSSVALAARHVPSFPLDTLWQEVRIPLSDFNCGRNQTDWSAISSMNLRMEHFGEVLVGACTLVPHMGRKKVERRAAKRPLIAMEPGQFIVFEENADHEWGLGDFGEDRQFIVKEKRGRSKSQALDCQWDCTPPPLSSQKVRFPDHTIGFSWNRWQTLAPPARPDAAYIVFKLRNIGVNPGPTAALPIEVGIEDGTGRRSSVALTQDLIPATGFGKWMECRIPFNAFDWATEDDPSGPGSISYIYFQFSEKGHVYIDDLSVRF